MYRKVTFEIKEAILRLDAEGKTTREIGIEVDLHFSTVAKLLKTDFESMGKYPCQYCGAPTNSELRICASNPSCEAEYKKEYYKDRQRGYYLKSVHGITAQEFDKMYDNQKGLCALCNKEITKSQAQVDHDHETGRNRALLCHHCNVGLGHFLDDPNILLAAAAYVISHKEELAKQ